MGNLTLPSLQEFHVKPQGTENRCGVKCHPFHMHVVPFQLQNLPKQSDYFQDGDWHDTFIHGEFEDVTVRFQLTTFTGDYVIHCHFLQHDDQGMMNYFYVSGKEGEMWQPARKIDPKCYFNAHTR